MHTLSNRLFKLADIVLLLTMILGSPMTATIATAAPAVPAAAESQVIAGSDAYTTESQVEPVPLLDGSGNADVQSDVGCMQESAGFGLNCTANDINIAKATNITILDDGCKYPGDTVTFKADFEVLLTAQARYDIGLWFATDGDPNNDAAKTGTCTVATPAYAPDPPWLDLDETVSGQQNDTCGDIDDAHNPLYPSVTLTVMCVDDDGNGKLDLPNCTSWRQPGDNGLCTSPVQAVPGAPSKCKCDTGFNVDVPVPGQIIVDKVTDPSGDKTNFDFSLTGGPDNVNIPFSLTDASDPYKSSYLYAGTYSVVETANSSYSTTAVCSDGSPANAVVLSPGEIVTCTFTNKLLTGTLIVKKDLINDNLGPKSCSDFSYKVDGGTATAFEAGCSNSLTVLAGAHTVVEDGVPIDGYTTTYNNCTNVNVPAGGSETCTITNDDIAKPAMKVTKSSTTTSITAAGQVVPYTFLVTNTGNQTLTGITVTDPNCAADPAYDSGDANSDGKLQVTESWTYTCSHTVTQDEINAGGNLSNTVTADSNETEPVTDNLSIPITKNAAMTVEKSSTTTDLSAPATVTYDYLVTNTGNVTLTGIALSDNNDNDDMTCPADTLAPTATMTCHATHTFTQAELDAGGTLDNIVTADTNETEPVTDNLSIPITKNAAMTVEKSSTTTNLSAPATVTYDYLVTNTGNVTLTGIALSDNNDNDDMTCPKTVLAVGENMTCHATHTFTQAELDAGVTLDNVVTASSNEAPDATDDLSIPITKNAAISIIKTGAFVDGNASGYADAGETITYTFAVKNEGNVTLTNVTVTDTVGGVTITGGPTTLDVGETDTTTFTGTYTLTQTDIDAGHFFNTATADSEESGPASDDEDVPLPPHAAIKATKTGTFVDGNGNGYADVGETITYTFTVRNTGNVTLSNVTISDQKVTVVGGPITLAPGQEDTTSFTASYLVTQADIDAGHVYNVALASGTPPSGPPVTDEPPTDTPLPQNPMITVEKTAVPTSVNEPGGDVTFTFKVTNTGNVTVTIATLSDTVFTLSGDNDCQVGTVLTVGSSCEFSQNEFVAGDASDPDHVNTFTATATDAKNNSVSDDDDATVGFDDVLPMVDLTKEATPATLAEPGGSFTYTLTIENKSVESVTITALTDDNILSQQCLDLVGITLAAGASTSCTYTVTQTEAGTYPNTASVTVKDNENNEATDEASASVNVTDVLPTVDLTKEVVGDATLAEPGGTFTFKLTIKNTTVETVTITALTDTNALSDECKALVNTTLAAGASTSCTYTVSHTEAGKYDNTAKVTVKDNENNEASDEATASVEVTDVKPTVDLTKDVTPTSMVEPGGAFTYKLTIKNTSVEEVTITALTDTYPLSAECQALVGTKLAAGASTSCTYTVTHTTAGKYDNTANVTVKDNENNEASDDASQTVTVYKQYGALLPTQTTCQQYASGQWPAMYSAFTYQVKSNKISSVSPGVIFYYNTITAPSASFTLNVVESNSLSWKPMLIQDLGQAVLYTSTCNKASGISVTTTNNPYTVQFTVTGATPGATYYIGIKYSPQNLVGQTVKATGGVYPTSIYSWDTTNYLGSKASIPVQPKK